MTLIFTKKKSDQRVGMQEHDEVYVSKIISRPLKKSGKCNEQVITFI